MPWIAPTTIVAVADALRGGAEIVGADIPRGSADIRLASRAHYGTLLASLTGDEGARRIVAARKWALQLIDVDDSGVLRDVDRPDDLARPV